MADVELARVLKQCSGLKHIEGTIKKQLLLLCPSSDLLMVTNPASFIDVFEPSKSITYFKVSYHKCLQQDSIDIEATYLWR